MTDIASLRSRFGIPRVLDFDNQNGLTFLHVNAPAARATVCLQGAHLTSWQPVGQDPVLFLSRRSELAPGRPIRGGVPIIFPWYGGDPKPDRLSVRPGPSHGFARIQEWTLMSAKLESGGLALELTLGPTETSRSMGFDNFLLELRVRMGTTLSMELTVTNRADSPLIFEEGFHNYFNVEDVHEASVSGLEALGYVDKTDQRLPKPATEAPITFHGPVDRLFVDTAAACTIRSGTQRRDIRLVKQNSRTTAVWNPARSLPDLGEWDWHEMVCVETLNAGPDARTLGPGESFTMGQTISVERWKQP